MKLSWSTILQFSLYNTFLIRIQRRSIVLKDMLRRLSSRRIAACAAQCESIQEYCLVHIFFVSTYIDWYNIVCSDNEKCMFSSQSGPKNCKIHIKTGLKKCNIRIKTGAKKCNAPERGRMARILLHCAPVLHGLHRSRRMVSDALSERVR